MSRPILLATNNAGKLREMQEILDRLRLQVVSPVDLGISLLVPETGTTFGGNAVLKAEAFCRRAGIVTLADDSGLVVDALEGGPGVRSARYGGPSASDEDRIRLVLDRMVDVPPERRTARFVAAVAVAAPDHDTAVFQAQVEGRIAAEPAGRNGFGYDPIFFYPPAGCTFAEMTADAKAGVSHRGQALRQAAEYLSGSPGILGCKNLDEENI